MIKEANGGNQMYALLSGDEDGRVFRPLSDEGDRTVSELLENPEDFGVDTFMTEEDLPEGWEKWDPQYWSEGNAMLIEFKICRVVNKETVVKREIAP